MNVHKQVNNRRLNRIQPLLTPVRLLEKMPADNDVYANVVYARKAIRNILHKEDNRFLIIVGPCSTHDEKASIEFAKRLAELQNKFADKFFFVMRVYFEKPRTVLGWRGLIVDPDKNDVINIPSGLEKARKILIEINKLGIPVATEFLDPIVPQYIADMVSWASVGARTSESQIHRELASGLSMPVGFKNATDGDMLSAVNAVVSANKPHGFIGITADGLSAVMHTTGNEDAHIVLRGGSNGSNFGPFEIQKAHNLLQKHNIPPAIIIDCSHDNSQKKPENQPNVFMSVLETKQTANSKIAESIRGIMLESFLQDGNTHPSNHNIPEHFGRSITDPCMGWELTMKTIQKAYKKFLCK
ncbi:MAG: 3-deoxy-7-phosphoheptulonate synthase [Treponema sp.]|nr:MAG: 3-deoxy-7-phosphoheptulonate synthase [Treponema sp.]